MRHSNRFRPAWLAAAVLCMGAARAAAPAPEASVDPSNSDQVIVPQVERREVHKPRYPSNDFQGTFYLGGYSAEQFGASGTLGARLAYHITEDWFAEASYGQTKINDKSFRQVLPGGVLLAPYERLQTYDLSLGYNVFAGEAFFGTRTARAYQTYVTAGLGNTIFDTERAQTWVYGVGSRLFFGDSWAVRVDVRNHLYKFDLLGQRQLSQNYELTAGASYFF
jgi:outer membrane beta-barrel protein